MDANTPLPNARRGSVKAPNRGRHRDLCVAPGVANRIDHSDSTVGDLRDTACEQGGEERAVGSDAVAVCGILETGHDMNLSIAAAGWLFVLALLTQ